MARKSAIGAADKAEMVRWLFENSRDLMQVVTPTGEIVEVNRAWTAFSGLGEAELIGRNILDFCHPDEIPGIVDRSSGAKPGDTSEVEVRLRASDGGWRWFAARRQVMETGHFIGNMRDIHAERVRRDEVEAGRRDRKMLGAAAGLGIWEFDPISNTIWWSEELLQLLGYDGEPIWSPERFYEIIHPRDRRPLRRALAHAIATGEATRLHHRIKARGRWAVMRATVQSEPRPGGVFALKGISEDITELAQARDAARTGEQKARRATREAQVLNDRLKLALEAAESGVYEIDHVKKSFWASPEFVRITGQADATYAEATELRFPGFHPDDLPHVRASFRALHRGDKRSGESFEARIVRPDGVERWVRVFHHLVTARNGRWLKAVGLVQDCDVLKRQEIALKEAQRAAESAAEAKSAFLANMSHEIRTPLNGVMGVLHLLSNENLSEDGRALLHEALSCGQMLAELLNDVIDFSKIEAGRLELACEAVDPAALAQGVVRLLEPQAVAKGLRLTLDADATLGWVRADPVRLRQALFNLVGNAVKFTERGHVLVRCRAGADDELRFEIEDTGVGIPAEAQARLFERFNQADVSTTRRFGGSGLGLAITRHLAEMMQGEVGFTSLEGQGSTFWLTIRAEAVPAPAEAAAAAEAVLDGVRVLVVEDNPTNRLIATKLLENLGASVETAADGHAGVEAAGRGGFDLILMDIQMPGIDGIEASRRIRAFGGASADTPIVALTANVLAHQKLAYLEAGIDGVVGKPIAPAALLAEIAEAAHRRATVSAAAA